MCVNVRCVKPGTWSALWCSSVLTRDQVSVQREQPVIEVARRKEVDVKGSQDLTFFVPKQLILELAMLEDICEGSSLRLH